MYTMRVQTARWNKSKTQTGGKGSPLCPQKQLAGMQLHRPPRTVAFLEASLNILLKSVT